MSAADAGKQICVHQGSLSGSSACRLKAKKNYSVTHYLVCCFNYGISCFIIKSKHGQPTKARSVSPTFCAYLEVQSVPKVSFFKQVHRETPANAQADVMFVKNFNYAK